MITSRIRSLRANVERRKGERDRLQKTIDDLTEDIRRDTVHARRLERALEIVKQVGLATQKQLEYHLAEQVSLAMEAVFDDPYRLKVNFEEKRGQTEVQLLFTRRGLEFPPIGSSGGGTIDVASLALRIAYWSMRRDQRPRPTLLLDEPFSQLKGEEANKRALAMLQEISHKLGIQVITVSDERVSREDIIANADRVFFTRQRDGVSKVSVL